FISKAKELGADFFATGHYCRKEEIQVEGKPVYRLLAGSDPNKDQSYFLCQLSQDQLKDALFPIGDMLKPEVREIAHKLDLASAAKKDSQGICFVGKVDLPTFLQQQLKPREGRIIEIPANRIIDQQDLDYRKEEDLKILCSDHQYEPEMGKVVGEHKGAHFYTIGQRKGLDVGGTPEPLFIIATDINENIIYVGQGKKHPGLFRKGLFVQAGEIHWIRPDKKLSPGQEVKFGVRIRYRQAIQQATLLMKVEGLFIVFDEPQRGITSGQFAAWYEGEELLGSGVID
ncbi:MAG: tRNA 2-thiouridine(34) synthase MnmA, partial [Bacteroidales bacterium]|nr:tRNA 2-thiouridine(34) synthase MnmA [Bacteroidales bacterium]